MKNHLTTHGWLAGAAAILALILGGAVMFGLFGCGAKKYRVDYDGEIQFYKGAKDEYAAGEEVKLRYDLIATDTDYSFYLDGERINTDYDDKYGFIIKFTMPEHDVKLECRSYNSMVYTPPIEEGTVLIDYYDAVVGTDGYDRYDEMVLTYLDRFEVKLDVYGGYMTDDDGGCVSYVVPYSLVEECYDIIEEEGFRTWSDRDDLTPIDGAFIKLEFYDEDEEDYVRVSSEEMPEDGERSFGKIRAAISAYINDTYKID
ncbi:MAG: hypothetical protein IJT70_01955 [Clostridia bacterium]|nr:hypothetical protein [Clostridia bacterium]